MLNELHNYSKREPKNRFSLTLRIKALNFLQSITFSEIKFDFTSEIEKIDRKALITTREGKMTTNTNEFFKLPDVKRKLVKIREAKIVPSSDNVTKINAI